MKRRAEIAGAGIAGLTAGLALAQKGWRVRVHEWQPTPRRPGGVYVRDDGLRVLAALGVLPRAIDGVVPAGRHEKRSADGRCFAASPIDGDFPLYVPPRTNLAAALLDAFVETGGEVVFGSRAISAQPEGVLQFANGYAARADLVIGADGINSAVRDSLGLLHWRRPAGQFGYRAIVQRESGGDDIDVHCEHWHGTRRLLYVPCTTDLAHVQLTSLAGDEAGNLVPIDRGLWRALFPRLATIVDGIPDDGRGDWFESIRLKSWSCGRVAIVGDAASAQLPFLGQDGGSAMTSAFVLAQLVDREREITDGIVEWELRERPFVEWVQRVAHWYGQLAYLNPALRAAAFKMVDGNRWLRRQTRIAGVARDPTALWPRRAEAIAEATMHFLMH